MSNLRKIYQYSFVVLMYFNAGVVIAQPSVEYTVEITDPVQHLAQITAIFPATGQTKLDIMLPAWRTGKYRILNLASGIGEARAFGEYKQALMLQKIDKSTWRVTLDKPQAVTFTYELYADQLGMRTRHIDETHAFLDASAVLVYTGMLRAHPVSINLKVPEAWQSRSGLQQTGKHQFTAPNYDVLVDSPIETGLHAYYDFVADHKKYELVIWGKGNQDDQQIIEDLKNISVAAGNLWGRYPFERYVWMLHLTSGPRGATEHINSTIIQKDRFKFSPRKNYLDFLTTAAHELIHTWNVKAYRPEGIYPYDYQQENYTQLLWLAEGSTSYFSPLLLFRAGVIDGKEFLGDWAKAIDWHLNRPGRQHQSPAAASFDAWLEESPQWEQNAKANIYGQGMMASWVLDMYIREYTGLKKGYEHVHRLLYERYPLAKGGYQEADVLKLLNEVSGHDMGKIWNQYIQGTEQINIDAMLSKLGLEKHYGDSKKTGDKAKDPQLPWTGMRVVKSGHDARLQGVQRDSPAWQAGLTADDVIVAINDDRVSRESLPDRLKDYQAGDILKISFFRHDRLKSAHLKLIKRSAEKLKLAPLKKATKTQKAFFKAWSGLEWSSLKSKSGD